VVMALLFWPSVMMMKMMLLGDVWQLAVAVGEASVLVSISLLSLVYKKLTGTVIHMLEVVLVVRYCLWWITGHPLHTRYTCRKDN